MTTIRETERAILVEIDGNSTWVPKSWVKDNNLEAVAREKLAKEASDYIPVGEIVEEREKAIKVKGTVAGEVAPAGGFVSSLIRDKRLPNWSIWLPKFAMRKTESGWMVKKDFLEEKAKEILLEKVMNCQVLSATVIF